MQYILSVLGTEFAFTPVLSAKGGIFFICAENNLFALFDNSVFIKTGVPYCFFPAPADCLDLFNGIRPRKKPHTPLEQIAPEVPTKSVAYDGNGKVIDNVNKKLNLFLCQKLRFINDKTVYPLEHFFGYLVKQDALALKTAA